MCKYVTLIMWNIEADDFNHSLVTCFLCCLLTDIKQTFTVLSVEVKISQMFLFLCKDVLLLSYRGLPLPEPGSSDGFFQLSITAKPVTDTLVHRVLRFASPKCEMYMHAGIALPAG